MSVVGAVDPVPWWGHDHRGWQRRRGRVLQGRLHQGPSQGRLTHRGRHRGRRCARRLGAWTRARRSLISRRLKNHEKKIFQLG